MDNASQEKSVEGLRSITWIVYGLQVLGIFVWFADIAGLIVNIVKRDEAESDSVIASHFRWQIRTFWWSLLWLGIGICLWIFLIGIPILIGAWIWSLYRIIRGMMALSEHKPPKPGY